MTFEMIFTIEGRIDFSDGIVDLVKQKENEKLQSILQNSPPTRFVDSDRTTLLHLAAKYNNVEFAQHLLRMRWDINSRDSLGTTPICTAAISRNYEIVKVLLDAGADIFIADNEGSSLLKHFLSGETLVPGNIFVQFFDNLKKIVQDELLDSGAIAKYLIDADCPLEYGMSLRNSEVTKLMIQHDYFEILLNPCQMLAVIDDPSFDLTVVKSHVHQLATWDISDDHFFYKLMRFFMRTSNDKAMRMLLDFGILDNMRETFKLNLLPHLFCNPYLDCASLLENRDFDVDFQYENKSSLLQQVTYKNNQKYVEFLLDSGADPNSKNIFGFTPIYYVQSVECMRLLLRRGADIQSVDKRNFTFFHYKHNETLLKEGFAHLSIIEAQGTRVIQQIGWVMRMKDEMAGFYDECRGQIEWMKGRAIGENFTVFDALCSHPRDTFRYFGREGAAARILDCCRGRKLGPQFLAKLEGNLNDVVEVHKLKTIAASVISESIGLLARDRLIVHRILSYFDYDDLFVFS